MSSTSFSIHASGTDDVPLGASWGGVAPLSQTPADARDRARGAAADCHLRRAGAGVVDGRPSADAAGRAAAAAVLRALVRLRSLRSRRLHAHALRRAGLA